MAAVATDAAAPPDWITAAELARTLGIDPSAVRHVVIRNGVRVRHVPGTNPRYSRADVAALRERSVFVPEGRNRKARTTAALV